MDWVCPHDRGELRTIGEERVCATCGERFAAQDEVVRFTSDRPAPSALTKLWNESREHGFDEAARRFCETEGCSRNPNATDWKFFLPLSDDATLLELGAGCGDDSVALVQRVARAWLVVPDATAARIVRSRMAQHDFERARVAVLDRLNRLPLPDESVDAIVLEDAAAPGFDLTRGSLADAATEWKRVLRPGGTLLLGLSNPLTRIPGASLLVGSLHAKSHTESLNRRVKRASTERRSAGPGPRAVINTLRRQGFAAPEVYAPLPDEKRTQIVVPVDDARTVRYFLNNLIRRNSPVVSAAVQAANAAVSLNLFRYFVPYSYLIFRRPS